MLNTRFFEKYVNRDVYLFFEKIGKTYFSRLLLPISISMLGWWIGSQKNSNPSTFHRPERFEKRKEKEKEEK